jgi:hypothetical protein
MQQADSSDPYADPFNVKETIRVGDSLIYLFQFGNGTGPLDITGYQFVFTAKKSKSDPDSAAVAQTFYTAQSGTVSQAGQLAFEAINRLQSEAIPGDATYEMDLRYLTPANQGTTFIHGWLTVITPVGQSFTQP